ncbi:MAG: class I SAM-dependent methyltransferase [Xanthomonadales bacterium]|jgi:SAM-dependent methyltransferase|nr:class I SAM-dependent methyltransferase [Xanthomonadales bacterium]
MTPARESFPFQPTAASLAVIDEARSRIHSDDPALETWTTSYLAEHRLRLGTDLDLARQRLEPGARILDVGAAPLVTTAALQASGFDVCAIDLDPERFQAVIENLGLDVRRCDIETEALPVADGSMDAVVFNELFEHLRIDPIFTLGEVLRVLRPGGVLLLSTPNLRSFRGLRNLLLKDQGHAVSGGIYRQYEKLHSLGHMGHVREYTVTETCDFLHRVGFDITAIIYRGGYGRGAVGMAERLLPSLRPFFSVVAQRPPERHGATRDRPEPRA